MNRWYKSLWKFKTLIDAFSIIGLSKFIDEILSFYLPSNDKVLAWLKLPSTFYAILIISIIYAVIRNRPRDHFEYQLDNRDVSVAIKVSDAFKNKGTLIVPINDEFDVDLRGNALNSKSILSTVVKKYFSSKPEDLKAALEAKLTDATYQSRENDGKYDLGTVVEINKKGKKFFFVVSSVKKSNQRTYVDKDIFDQTLPELWYFIAEELSKEDTIIIPLLGTGMGRLNITREQVAQELIQSFIAACSDKVFCNKLIISIHPEDVSRYKMELEKLNEFLKAKCLYVQFENKRTRTGTPQP